MTLPMLRVVEIPAGLSAQEVEARLNAPYTDGYYLLHTMLAEMPVVFRAVYKLRQAETRSADRDAAHEFIKANPRLSINDTVAHLAVKGIVRSRDWVGARKRAFDAGED